VYLP